MLIDLTAAEVETISMAMKEWKSDTRHCGAIRQNCHELLLRMEAVEKAILTEETLVRVRKQLTRESLDG